MFEEADLAIIVELIRQDWPEVFWLEKGLLTKDNTGRSTNSKLYVGRKKTKNGNTLYLYYCPGKGLVTSDKLEKDSKVRYGKDLLEVKDSDGKRTNLVHHRYNKKNGKYVNRGSKSVSNHGVDAILDAKTRANIKKLKEKSGAKTDG
jgi:hypothetical protein